MNTTMTLSTDLTAVHARDLEPLEVFCFSLANPTAAYVEPGDRAEWGGVPWQISGKPPSGGVFMAPDLEVLVPKERCKISTVPA